MRINIKGNYGAVGVGGGWWVVVVVVVVEGGGGSLSECGRSICSILWST